MVIPTGRFNMTTNDYHFDTRVSVEERYPTDMSPEDLKVFNKVNRSIDIFCYLMAFGALLAIGLVVSSVVLHFS